MQNDALNACTTKKRKNRGGNSIKKPAFKVPVRVASVRLPAAYCANNTVEAHAGNNQKKNSCPRIFINER